MRNGFADNVGGRGRSYVNVYDGWGEFLDEVGKPPIGRNCSSEATYDPIWSGTRSYQEAIDLAKFGWKEGIAKADVLSRAITTKMGSMIRKMHLLPDVEGCAFDVGAIVQNEPECWIRPHYKIQKGHSNIMRICINVSASAGITPDVMIARGSVAAALIKLLEQGGKRVEVWIADASKNGNDDKYESFVLIKRTDQPLDLARMIFAAAHPATLRRLMFRTYERMPVSFQEQFSGYGRPCECSHFPDNKRPDILIGHALLGDVQWQSQTSAIAWIKETLIAQGVKLG